MTISSRNGLQAIMDNKALLIPWTVVICIALTGCLPAAPSTPVSPDPTDPAPQGDTPEALQESSTPSQPKAEISTDDPELGVAYTRDHPTKDNRQIVAILDSLLDRFLAQFSKAGWYSFHYQTDDLTHGDNFWLHIPEAGKDRFDEFLYTRQYTDYANGSVWPASLTLSDGSWGYAGIKPGMEDYQFRHGGRQPEHPTTLANLDYFGLNWNGGVFGNTALQRFIRMVENPEDRMDEDDRAPRAFSGWVDAFEGRQVFVLLTHKTFPGSKPLLEDSHNVVDSQDVYTYFDWTNGGRIAEKSIFFLEKGGVVENEGQFNQHQVEYHETLPPDVQAIYDRATEKLRAYLSGKQPRCQTIFGK